MAMWDTPEHHGKAALQPSHPLVHFCEFEPAERSPLLSLDLLRDSASSDVLTAAKLWRCRTEQNLTGASLPQIRRGLALAWRLMLRLRVSEALAAIDTIELQVDDVPIPIAKRLGAATHLLRAVGLALQDDALAALAIASSHLSRDPTALDGHAASTLCRLGFWQLGKLDAFYALPRHRPRLRCSRSHATLAMLDLSIDAAMALDHLKLTTARRLASDAMALAERAKLGPGLAALPAAVTAQVLYEEGCLDDAQTALRDHVAAINAEGLIESALRAYLVLARIARQRLHYDLAAMVLHEAEILGQRRQWPRLVAAAITERVSLLLEAGRIREARLSVNDLARYVETQRGGSGFAAAEIAQNRALARWRISWAESRSTEAVAALRQLYHHAVDRHDLYTGCRLAVELADMLASIGEIAEADMLFFHTVKSGAAVGLYQVFLERREGLRTLLRRAYDRANSAVLVDREALPFLGSLLSRWETSSAEAAQAPRPSAISDTLTARERDILSKIGEGLPNKRIARILEISPETVKSHVKNIFLKLAVGARAEAVSRGKSLGLL